MSDVFISHIHEETGLAAVIKVWIEDAFKGNSVSAFLSSDPGDLPSSRKWLDVVEERLKASRLLVSLLSPLAIERPWINIELGGAWMRGLPVIPLYHSGLSSGALPRPFQDFKGVGLDSPDAAKGLIQGVADALKLKHPTKLAFDQFREEMLAQQVGMGSGNRWGITITTPSADETVSRKVTVRGSIQEPLPPGYGLRVLRSHPNSGAVAPGGYVNVGGRGWEALDVDLGGDPGELRGIEVWVVGPDGEALLKTWEKSASVHYDVNQQLKGAVGHYGRWLPYIDKTTRDMFRCHRVVVRRKT